MTERSIVEAAARLRRHGEPHLVATVISAAHGTYRPPGARMLLTRFRWVAGSVTGGLLEGDLARTGWANTAEAPSVVRFDGTRSGSAEDDDVRSAFGLGADGAVEVLLERAGRPGRIDALEVAYRCFRSQRPGAVATIVSGPSLGARLALVADGELEEEVGPIEPLLREAIAADLRAAIDGASTDTRTYVTADGELRVLVEAIIPPPRLFLFAVGHDAVPIAQLAHQIGWDVVVCSPGAPTDRSRTTTRERFAFADEVIVGSVDDLASRIALAHRPVAIVMTHDADRDRALQQMLLGTAVPYIGVLAARVTDSRVHVVSPGRSPQQHALAMIAAAQRATDPTPPDLARPTLERPIASRPSAMFAAVAAV